MMMIWIWFFEEDGDLIETYLQMSKKITWFYLEDQNVKMKKTLHVEFCATDAFKEQRLI